MKSALATGRDPGERAWSLRRWLPWGLWLGAWGFSLLSLAAEPPLRFLGNEALAPVVWRDHGTVRGVAVDLVNAAALQAGLSIRIEASDWQQAQEELRDGRADALIQINPTPQRLALYDFSDPLLASHFHIFRRIRDVQISGLDDLKGRKVGVEKGGFPIAFLQQQGQIEVVVLPSWSAAFERLHAGELDAVFVDRWVGEYELYQHKFNTITLIDPPVVTTESRIAVKKGHAALLAGINEGLRLIDRDGTRQAILDKWQAKEIVYLTRESIDRIVFAATLAAALLLLGVAAYLFKQRKNLRLAYAALQATNAQLSRMASTDALTGLWSRRHFEEQAAHEKLRADRYPQPLSLLIFDIDHFKWVNDRHGHLIGDQVLTALSQMARRLTRDSDLVARWGGEEFIILMPNTAAPDAGEVAEKLRSSLASHPFAPVGTITASFGLAQYQPGESLDQWISRADSALYEAKQAGRNTVKLAPARSPVP